MPRSPVRRADADAAAIGARLHPDRVALIDADGGRLTYRELDAGADRIANAWRGIGVRDGDRVALWLANGLPYLLVYLGCLRAGAVVVQLNHRHTSSEARYQLESSAAEVLVFDDSVAERVADLGIPLRHTITTESIRPVAGTERLWGLMHTSSTAPIEPRQNASELAVLGYTSGTTGHPKGAELTHDSIRTIGDTNMLSCRYTLGSVQVFGFSLSFTAGIPAHILPHLRVGGTTVLLRTWDTERLVDEIARHRATFTLLPSPPLPEFCEIIERDPRRVESLVSVLHSTARAPESHLERLVQNIGPRLVEGWGMTENSGGLMTATTVADYANAHPGIFSSAGRAVPGTEIRLTDESGAPLAADGSTVGLLQIRTPSLARRYWRDEKASAESFRNGWFATGDLGSIDGNGYVRLIDRRSDLIISGGMNVYPSEVERVLAEAPNVGACAVVGAPHARWGRTPVAFIVPTDPDAVRVGEILEYARLRLASYKLPTEVRIVPELPTNSGGKVLRTVLAAQLEIRE